MVFVAFPLAFGVGVPLLLCDEVGGTGHEDEFGGVLFAAGEYAVAVVKVVVKFFLIEFFRRVARLVGTIDATEHKGT